MWFFSGYRRGKYFFYNIGQESRRMTWWQAITATAENSSSCLGIIVEHTMRFKNTQTSNNILLK